MHDLTRFSLRDMTDCAAALRKLDAGAKSMEEVATRIVRYLHEHFIDQKSGERACALVRLFVTLRFELLDEELQAFARSKLQGMPDSPVMKCLTLLGSAGSQPEWNARTMSAGHKAFPLPSAQFTQTFPMFSQLIKQFGLEIGRILEPGPSLLMDLEQTTYNVFYVPEAKGSPYIPAQEGFVIPFGIQSVLGFGGILPPESPFMVILFSKVHIPLNTAQMFRTLALSAKVALLPFVGQAVFDRVQQVAG
jgi:hypothetical protein